MTDGEALAVAVHRTAHRASEGAGAEPCGDCRHRAGSLLSMLPPDWALVDVQAWRRGQRSRAARDARYEAGLADGAARERERIEDGMRRLLAP